MGFLVAIISCSSYVQTLQIKPGIYCYDSPTNQSAGQVMFSIMNDVVNNNAIVYQQKHHDRKICLAKPFNQHFVEPHYVYYTYSIPLQCESTFVRGKDGRDMMLSKATCSPLDFYSKISSRNSYCITEPRVSESMASL